MKIYKGSTTDDPPCVMIYPLQMKITIFLLFFAVLQGHFWLLNENSKNMLLIWFS